MANNPSNQHRNLKPSAPGPGPAGYSASPSQLSLSSGPQSLGDPYQPQPTFPYSPHDPYGFQQPPHAYRGHPPPLQQTPQQLPQPPHPGHPSGPLSTGSNQGSPALSRKRRSSDVNTDPHGPGGPGGGGPGGGGGGSHPGSSSSFIPPMDSTGGGPGSAHHPDTSGLPQHPHQQAGQPPQPGGPGGAPSGSNSQGQGGQQGQQQQGMPSPAAKKGRTNTPWTPAEEQRLKTLRDAGSSWSDIAKMFPTRTEGSVKKHWYKDMHYAEFAADESAALLQAMKEYENNKWKAIGQKLGKPAKACEQFAKDQGWKV